MRCGQLISSCLSPLYLSSGYDSWVRQSVIKFFHQEYLSNSPDYGFTKNKNHELNKLCGSSIRKDF